MPDINVVHAVEHALAGGGLLYAHRATGVQPPQQLVRVVCEGLEVASIADSNKAGALEIAEFLERVAGDLRKLAKEKL